MSTDLNLSQICICAAPNRSFVDHASLYSCLLQPRVFILRRRPKRFWFQRLQKSFHLLTQTRGSTGHIWSRKSSTHVSFYWTGLAFVVQNAFLGVRSIFTSHNNSSIFKTIAVQLANLWRSILKVSSIKEVVYVSKVTSVFWHGLLIKLCFPVHVFISSVSVQDVICVLWIP